MLCTPSRPARAGELLTSPYFARKKRRRSSSPSTSCKRGQNKDLPYNREEEQGDDALFNDPLFCFYFRSFARLYHQLWLLKPVLIQERVADDPWKVIIAVTLLNKTAGKAAIPVFWDIITRYPTPNALAQANEADLTFLIRPLGLQSVRANRLIRLSMIYLEAPPSPEHLYKSNVHIKTTATPTSSPSKRGHHNSNPPLPPSKRQPYPPTPISHIPGTGPYALDSYRIFCTPSFEPDAWKDVMPTDKELVKYLKWKWAFEERMLWMPEAGVVGSVDIKDLELLIDELKK